LSKLMSIISTLNNFTFVQKTSHDKLHIP